MPALLRIVILVSCIAIGAVLVRHITEALQGIPPARQTVSGQPDATLSER